MHDLASWFKLDEIDIDNWMFKLYYRASALLCMTGATVGIATQYFGDPIRWSRLSHCQTELNLIEISISSCEFQGINSDLAQDFCWIHGTSYIPPQYQVKHIKIFSLI